MVCSFIAHAAPAEEQTLEQAWALAYQNDPSLESKRAELRALDEQVSQALSHWRPDIEATASGGRVIQDTPSLSAFGNGRFQDTQRNYGVQVTQPLFRGFRTTAETESAEKQVMAGRAKLAQAEQQLFLDTAAAFLGVVRGTAITELDRGYEEVLARRLTETKARLNAGELTQTDVRQAESRLARAHVSRYQAETELRRAADAYARLVGSPSPKLTAPALAAGDYATLDALLAQAGTHNPDVIAAQFRIEQAHAEVALNRGSLLPEVNLVGSSSRASGQSALLPGRQDTSQLMVQVSVPIYRTGADYSKTRAAQQTYAQRRMDREDALNQVRETAADAWQAYSASTQALEADRTEVDAAAKALAGVKEESRVGTRTTLDVLNAEQELLDARLAEARSRYERDFALLQTRAAAGELTAEALHLPGKRYDPALHYQDVRYQLLGFGREDARYAVSPARAGP